MSNSARAGRFIWHELMTTDMATAEAFYRAVIGWEAEPLHHLEVPYTRFSLAGRPVAGLLGLPPAVLAEGALPGWIGHVAVSDVDVAAAMAQDLGGRVYVAPKEIPGIGRLAVLGDPQGAVIGVFAAAFVLTDGVPAEAPGAPGRFGWNELLADDWPAALAFYAALFGWRKSAAVELGPMGTYQTFGQGEAAFGGMFDKPAAVPQPFWLYYLTVADIDAGAARVAAAGGQVLLGPMEIPGGGWILQALDPQGAIFALLGPRVQK